MKINDIVQEGFWGDLGSTVKSMVSGTAPAPKAVTTQDTDNQLYQMWATRVKDLQTGGLLPTPVDPTNPANVRKYKIEMNKFLKTSVDPRIASRFPPIPTNVLSDDNACRTYLSQITAIRRSMKDTIAAAGPAPAPAPVQDNWTPDPTNPKFGTLKLANGKSFIKDTDKWYRVDSSGAKEPSSTLSRAQYATLNKRLKDLGAKEFE